MKYVSSLLLVILLGACSSGSIKNNRSVANSDLPPPCGYSVIQKQSELSSIEVENGSFPQFTQDDLYPNMLSARVQSQALGGVIEISRGAREELYSFQVLSIAGKTQGSLKKPSDTPRPYFVKGSGSFGNFTVQISCH